MNYYTRSQVTDIHNIHSPKKQRKYSDFEKQNVMCVVW